MTKQESPHDCHSGTAHVPAEREPIVITVYIDVSTAVRAGDVLRRTLGLGADSGEPRVDDTGGADADCYPELYYVGDGRYTATVGPGGVYIRGRLYIPRRHGASAEPECDSGDPARHGGDSAGNDSGRVGEGDADARADCRYRDGFCGDWEYRDGRNPCPACLSYEPPGPPAPPAPVTGGEGELAQLRAQVERLRDELQAANAEQAQLMAERDRLQAILAAIDPDVLERAAGYAHYASERSEDACSEYADGRCPNRDACLEYDGQCRPSEGLGLCDADAAALRAYAARLREVKRPPCGVPPIAPEGEK